jgi:TIR domain
MEDLFAPVQTRKVFISYSAKPCEGACPRNPACPQGQCARAGEEIAFRDRLIAKLQGDAIEVLHDRNQLFVGVDWKERLYPAFASCHACIILLTQSSLNSIYVPLEAMVLTWRRLLNPGFEVLPVYFEGINENLFKDPASRFYGIGLEDIQAIKCNDNDVLNTISIKVRNAPLPKPLEELAALHRLAALIETVGPAGIDGAASKLKNVTLDWDPLLPKPLQLAGVLLQRRLREVLNCVAAVCQPLAPRERQELLDLLAPRWVNARAAEPVWRFGAAPNPKPVLVINAKRSTTVEHYVLRAWSHDWAPRWPVLSVNGVSATIGGSDLISNVLREFALKTMSTEYSNRTWDEGCEDETRAVLSQRAQDGQPVYVVLKQAPGITLDTARQLQTILGITVLYNADLPQIPADPGVVELAPRLTAAQETEAFTDTLQAQSIMSGDGR